MSACIVYSNPALIAGSCALQLPAGVKKIISVPLIPPAPGLGAAQCPGREDGEIHLDMFSAVMPVCVPFVYLRAAVDAACFKIYAVEI